MSKKKKILPELRFPEFDNTKIWELPKLEDRMEIFRGASPRPKGDPKYYGGDIPRLMIEDVTRDGKYSTPRIDFLTKEGAAKSRLLKKGSVVLSCSGTRVAIPGILEVDACIHDGWLGFKNLKNIDTEFLYYHFVNLHNRIQREALAGGVFNNLTTTILRELRLAFPILKEQKKIAACLSSLDDLIEVHNHKLDALQAHKKGLMQNLFPQEGEKVPKFRFPEFEKDGEWELNPFSKYIKLYRGSSPRPIREYLTQRVDGINWIKIGDTSSITDFVIRNVSEKITAKGAEKSREVKSGELILANSMSYGNTYQLALDGCIYDGWFVLREYDEVFDKQFLLQLLNSNYMQEQYKKFAAGGIVQNISSEIVYSTLVPKTSVTEQQKIASCLSTLDKAILAQKDKIEQLKEHKKGLMQGLFPNLNEIK